MKLTTEQKTDHPTTKKLQIRCTHTHFNSRMKDCWLTLNIENVTPNDSFDTQRIIWINVNGINHHFKK